MKGEMGVCLRVVSLSIGCVCIEGWMLGGRYRCKVGFYPGEVCMVERDICVPLASIQLFV